MKRKKRKTEVGGQEAGEWGSTEELGQLVSLNQKLKKERGFRMLWTSHFFVALIQYSS